MQSKQFINNSIAIPDPTIPTICSRTGWSSLPRSPRTRVIIIMSTIYLLDNMVSSAWTPQDMSYRITAVWSLSWKTEPQQAPPLESEHHKTPQYRCRQLRQIGQVEECSQEQAWQKRIHDQQARFPLLGIL